MFEARPAGSTLVLHRRFWPTFFPRDEAGPAAVFDHHMVSWEHVADLARALHSGAYHLRHTLTEVAWLGWRPGRERTVQLLSPEHGWEPGALDLAPTRDDFSWQRWSPAFEPSPGTDVVIIWQPGTIFPGISLYDIAAQLLPRWFGGGGIYDAGNLWPVSVGAKPPHPP